MLSADDCLRYCAMEFHCPHCNSRLQPCETPPFHIGDGLGWGAEVMFVCLNNECPPYKNGWQHIDETYGHVGSYRYMRLHNEKKGELMMVGSEVAFTGSVLDPEAIIAANKRYQQEKVWYEQLDESIESNDLTPALGILLDDKSSRTHRFKACDTLLKIKDITCYDAIRNHTFEHPDLEHKVNTTLTSLLKVCFKKECPDCAEIIQEKAKKCKHCQKDLSS